MSNTELLIVVGIVAFFVGVLIGFLIARFWAPGQSQKALEQTLAQTQEKLDRYQHGVTDHFMDTAKIVAELNNNYKDLYQHLSKSAVKLTSQEVSSKILALTAGAQTQNLNAKDSQHHDDIVDASELSPPKDYAPKTPGQDGMLSEDFALNDAQEEPNIEVKTASGKMRANTTDGSSE